MTLSRGAPSARITPLLGLFFALIVTQGVFIVRSRGSLNDGLDGGARLVSRGIGEVIGVGGASGSSETDWVTARCKLLESDASYRELPRGGQLYRLGDASLGERATDSQQFVVIAGKERSSWDMLFSDFSGAFDQVKSTNTTLFIPWKEPHSPVFLVLYQQADVYIVRVQKRNAALAGSNVTNTCSVQLQRAAGLAGEVALGDGNRVRHIDGETGVQVELLDSEETFRYPVREPFFRRRLNSSGLVTVCTQLTVDRLQRLEALAATYAGPVSAVVYIGFRGEASAEVEQVARLWNSSTTLQQFVDLHLVYDDNRPWYATGLTKENHGSNPYPVNYLRQYAVERATTDFVLYLEADMATVPNAHSFIAKRWDDMLKVNAGSNGTVFVVPIYYSKSTNSSDMMERIPSNKSELKMMQAPSHPKRLMRMGERYKSHAALAYGKWESSTDGAFVPYDVSGNPKAILEKKQEPYFIIRKQLMPPYNVLFAGMGQDKETHTRDTNACGFVFYLHPSLFAVNFEQKQELDGWTNPPRRGNSGWRQIYAHSMHEAYKQELYRAGRGSQGGKFLCNSEGLQETSARSRQFKIPPMP